MDDPVIALGEAMGNPDFAEQLVNWAQSRWGSIRLGPSVRHRPRNVGRF